jgi:hypothetical protein
MFPLLGMLFVCHVNVRRVSIARTSHDHSAAHSQLTVEAFNLKAAIEYQLENVDDAKRALADMPPRDDEELDPVTLHNNALVHMDADATTGFKKLNFLLSQPPFPPETFGNLLLLYVKHQIYDLAADVLAENTHLHESGLSPEYVMQRSLVTLVCVAPERETKLTINLQCNTHILQAVRLLGGYDSDAGVAGRGISKV